MKLGMFLMPSHPPERSISAGHNWDLEVLRAADSQGYAEAWIGEHFTTPWEPNPAPDLLVAQALVQTKQIKLAPGAHLLPFHHPAELACRVACMDHLAQGRYMLGIGIGGLPTDLELFNIDGASGQHRAMTREALEIMLKVWQGDIGSDYKGNFWHVTVPHPQHGSLKHHLKPFQQPHPPIGVAGLSPHSDTLKIAGEHGFMPLSLDSAPGVIRTHWAAVMEGAARTGRTPDRRQWRIVRDILLADTDEQARRACLEGGMARAWREYMMPLYKEFEIIKHFKHDLSVADDEMTAEYLVDHGWMVGSPRTVTAKLKEMYEQVGGFGTVIQMVYDDSENPEPWFKSMRLLAEEVMPALATLEPPAVT